MARSSGRTAPDPAVQLIVAGHAKQTFHPQGSPPPIGSKVDIQVIVRDYPGARNLAEDLSGLYVLRAASAP